MLKPLCGSVGVRCGGGLDGAPRPMMSQRRGVAAAAHIGDDLLGNVDVPEIKDESQPYVIAFDTEYTSIDFKAIQQKFPRTIDQYRQCKVRPASVGWALFDKEGKVMPGYPVHKLVKPKDGWEVSDAASKIHGITQKMVEEDGVDIETVLADFNRDVQLVDKNSGYKVGHNVVGDLSLLFGELDQIKQEPWVKSLGKSLYDTRCTLAVSGQYSSSRGEGGRWMKLEDLFNSVASDVGHSDMLINNAHNAAVDAEMTGHAFFGLAQYFNNFDFGVINVGEITGRSSSQQTETASEKKAPEASPEEDSGAGSNGNSSTSFSDFPILRVTDEMCLSVPQKEELGGVHYSVKDQYTCRIGLIKSPDGVVNYLKTGVEAPAENWEKWADIRKLHVALPFGNDLALTYRFNFGSRFNGVAYMDIINDNGVWVSLNNRTEVKDLPNEMFPKVKYLAVQAPFDPELNKFYKSMRMLFDGDVKLWYLPFYSFHDSYEADMSSWISIRNDQDTLEKILEKIEKTSSKINVLFGETFDLEKERKAFF